MAFVIGAGCNCCKYTTCVNVCPVDAFREAPEFLVIDPETCIDCGVCEPECPVEAIYSDSAVPQGQEGYVEQNRRIAATAPAITRSKEAYAASM